jgi:uncharacterized protein (DUF1501 family)
MQDTAEWWSCDGRGGDKERRLPAPSRRDVVVGALSAALALWASRSALADITVNPKSETGDVLVTLFLRGGMDGLSLVVPYGDDDYYRARPTLALAAPKKTGGSVVDLDGFFGLHPAAAALAPFYREGKLAAVHAVGSGDQTRSHFEAMAAMERGLKGGGPDYASGAASGWIARYLNATIPTNPSPLRAVAFTGVLPDMLRGATDTSVLSSLTDYQLNAPAKPEGPGFAASLQKLYASGDDPVSRSGREIQKVLETLKRVDPAHYKPENGATYPQNYLGDGLRQVALLIKADVGLETAFLDPTGWDTHVGQGGATGFLAMRFKDVADALAAFANDLGPSGLSRVTVLVMTEFGRRVGENSGLGTDHGRGSSLLLLGGGVNGSKVYGEWPGLAPGELEPPGDLRVTTDYRTVLSEIVTKRLRRGNEALPTLFPGYASARPLGLVRSA